ncbi:acyltransferase family protein [Paenarthrobacter sp. 22069]|uniref:acyltransferase family protein n=1 Tax=Paenarthrobacter sp. 22069 TaxID=3453864 RepID=UPI003F86A8F6
MGNQLTSIVDEPRIARLDSLTGLRFFAAFVVLLRHTVPAIFPLPVLAELSLVGPIGVGFFFVLSGFILTWNWKPQASRGHFYGRRAARILPLHVLTTVVAAALLVAAGTPLWASTFLSLFLLQAWFTDSYRLGGNSPSWSLSVEAFFYILFPFIVKPLARMTIRKSWMTIGASGFLMVAWHGAYLVATKSDTPFLSAFSAYTNPVYRLGEFVIGVALATAMRQGWRPRLSVSSAAALALFGYVALAVLNAAVQHSSGSGIPLSALDLLYLPLTVLLVACAANSDLGRRKSFFRRPALVRLGEWSFAMYLVQAIVITIAVRLFPFGTVSWQGCLVAFGVIAFSVALSGALFHWFEKPMEGWLKSKLPATQPSRVRVLARR